MIRKFILAFLFILAIGRLPAADVYVPLSDFGLQTSVATNRTILVSGNSLPRGSSSSVALIDKRRVTTGVNSYFWISNALPGVYLIQVLAPPALTEFRILVPDTTAVIGANSNLVASADNTYPPDTVAWGAAASDARYLLRSEAIIGSDPNSVTNNETRDLVFNGELLVDQAATFNSSVALSGAFTTFGSQNWVNNNGQMRMAGGAFTNDAVGNVRATSFTASSGGFIGDGSQLTGLPASAGATNVHYGGSVTTSNVLTKIASGERTNANAALAYGGLQLSTTVYGQTASGNYNYRNGVEFWEPGWDGTIRDHTDLAHHPTAFVHSLTNWGGSTTANGAVLHIASAGNIRLEPNYGEPWWGQNYITLGNEDGNAPVVINDSAFSITNGANGNGYSLPLNFAVKGVVGGNTYSARPGIMGWFSGGLNSGPSTYDNQYAGILRFYSRTPTADRSYRTFGKDDPTTPIEVGQTSTNGWRLYGPVNLQQSVTYAVGTNVHLDFNGPSSQTIYLQSGVLTNFLQLTNVNVYRGSTNFEQRTFRLIAGGLDRPMRYPAWSTVSETGSTAPSSLLTAQKVMLLRLTAWGDGDTNVVCEFGTGTDATWAFDSDAAAFFTAASISDATQKGAVDTMVKALKGLNLYTNFVALWPMVGGNATAHSLNLVNTSLYPWTWVGTPTQDGNGVTGNGSSMYGTTTFNWSTHMGGQSLTNFHAAVYVRTTTPTDGGAFIGGRNGSSIGVGITREGASAGVRGAMNTLGPNAIVNLSTDLRGPIILSRANNFAAFDMATRLTAITTTTSDAVSVPSITPYLLAYNYNASASSYSSANVAFASVGWGFTSSQLVQVKAIMENYEAALSRNVP